MSFIHGFFYYSNSIINPHRIQHHHHIKGTFLLNLYGVINTPFADFQFLILFIIITDLWMSIEYRLSNI